MVEKKKPKKGAPGKAKPRPAEKSASARAPRASKDTRTEKAPKRPSRPKPTEKAPEVAAAPAAPEHSVFLSLHDLRPVAGATHKRKRVGRGPGSGHGKTAGRGSKGQKSRSGYRHLRGFEGGQMPLHRRVPKRGFTNIFRVEYEVVNLSDLNRFEAGQQVTPELLVGQRLARKSRPVKILGNGELQKPLTILAHKFSAGARSRIEAAGGRCEVLSR